MGKQDISYVRANGGLGVGSKEPRILLSIVLVLKKRLNSDLMEGLATLYANVCQ